MGLFDSLKSKKNQAKRAVKNAAAPENTVYHRGEYIPLYTNYDNLPDDLKTLRKMSGYYRSVYSRGMGELMEIEKEIFRKAYELAKQETPENVPEWVIEGYLLYFGTEEEFGAYSLGRFCEVIENLYVPKDYQKKHPDEDLVKSGLFDSWRSGYGYFQKKTYDYFEDHLEELIHAVCNLVEKEKQGTPLVYIGYVLYQELMKFCTKKEGDKKYFCDLWHQSYYGYLRSAHEYYDLLDGYKSDKKYKDSVTRIENNKAAIIDPIDQEAKINIQLCSEDELLSAWRNTTSMIAEKAEQRQQAAKAHQEALEQRKILADNGDVEAQVSLAKDAYYGRNGIPKDTARAFLLFSKAEKEWNGEAAYYLGEFYEKGVGHIIKDETKAEEYYRKALRTDYVPAIARMANQEREKGDKQNAIAHYKKVLALADEKEHTQYIKQSIRYLIFYLYKGDIDENTVGLISLAMDYMRLDAPLVKKSVCDIVKLMDEAANGSLSAVEQLEYYYEEYSHGPRLYGTIAASEIFQKDVERAREMMEIVKVLRLMKIAVLLPKVEKEPEKYLHELAIVYIKTGSISKAEELVEMGIRADLPSMLYVAYYYHKELDYEQYEAMHYLRRSAAMGYGQAIYMLEALEQQEARTREIMESGRQERMRMEEAARREREFDMELIERQIDLMMGGSGKSIDEKALTGELPFADASLLRHYKKKLLDH